MVAKLICFVCNKPITRGQRILAFDEFRPLKYEWDYFEETGVFDEVLPVNAQWNLAHFYCIFKKKVD